MLVFAEGVADRLVLRPDGSTYGVAYRLAGDQWQVLADSRDQ